MPNLPRTAEVLWHRNADMSEIRRVRLPDMCAGQVYLESIASLVSAGTETLVASGRVPRALQQTMRVPHMKGDFSFPCSYGYSVVAKVVEGEKNLVGKYVHVLHPHQSAFIVAIDEIYALPDDIEPDQAVLLSNVETVINAIWDSQCQIGDAIVVAGFGCIGALLALTLKRVHIGPIYIVESQRPRADIANSLSLPVRDWAEIEECAVSFHTSATERGLQGCIDAVGMEGRIVELSWYGTRSVNLQLGHEFHSKRKHIVSSQVSTIPQRKQALWTLKKRKALALTLIQEGIYNALPQENISFDKAPEFFQRLRDKKQNIAINTLFNYER